MPFRSLTVSPGRPISRLTNVPLALQAASAAAVGVLKTMISPRLRVAEVVDEAVREHAVGEARLAARRRAARSAASAPSSEDGIRYGFTTQALIASTIAIAPAIVTIQSIAIRQGRGSRAVIRSSGFRERYAGSASTGSGSGYGLIGGIVAVAIVARARGLGLRAALPAPSPPRSYWARRWGRSASRRPRAARAAGRRARGPWTTMRTWRQ